MYVITAQKGKHKGLPFGIPMTCWEMKDHATDFYFVWSIQKVSTRKKDKITYRIIPSAIQATLLSDELPVSVFKSCLYLKKRVSMKC